LALDLPEGSKEVLEGRTNWTNHLSPLRGVRETTGRSVTIRVIVLEKGDQRIGGGGTNIFDDQKGRHLVEESGMNLEET